MRRVAMKRKWSALYQRKQGQPSNDSLNLFQYVKRTWIDSEGVKPPKAYTFFRTPKPLINRVLSGEILTPVP